MSDLPDKVDCVILGTGLTNSILAASCSRVGKSVLHLDRNDYYGDHWASFSFDQLIKWTQCQEEETAHNNTPSSKNEPPCSSHTFSNVNVVCPTTEKLPDEEWTVERLKEKSKLFSVDLRPQLIYSNGSMVELLVQSNVARYHEFKNTVRLISMIDGRLQVLPCKRNEVFSSKILSNIIDKRRLMKFLETCLNFNEEHPEQSELNDHLSKDIEKCLIERDLGKNLREIIINAIAMVDPKTSTLVACLKVKKFLLSVERFGKSPFLYPMYGCGEFPQSFCRLCAVFGGVYCLNKQPKLLQINDTSDKSERITVRMDGDKIVKCSNVIMDYSYTNLIQCSNVYKTTIQSRAILITTRSTQNNDEQMLVFSRFTPGSMSNQHTVSLLEVDSSVMVCPVGLRLVYLLTQSYEDNATKDLMPIVEKLFVNKSDVIWSCYYNQRTFEDFDNSNNGMFVTSSGSSDIDYDDAINEAKGLFRTLFPDEQEFLPRAPDSDEIIFGDVAETE